MSSTVMEVLLLLCLVLPVGIRWILHVPSGFVMSAGYYYDQLRDMKDVYDVVPGADDLIEGQLLVGTAGTVLLWWNFANIAVCGFAGSMGGFQTIIGLVDLGITVSIITGLAMQASILPNSYGGCNAMAEDSKFFQAASKALHDTQTPQAVCRNMVWTDKFCTAVVCLYAIVTLANLFMGFTGIVNAINARWPDLLSNLGSEWLHDKAGLVSQSTKRHVANCYNLGVRTCGQVKDTTLVFVAVVRDMRRRRAAANDESLAEMAVKDEEELGLISRSEEEEENRPKDVEEERVGLMAEGKDQDGSDSDTSRRWSEDTVTGGRADTRA